MVFVLDSNRKPMDPCHSARARQLLKEGKAAVFRRYPFTIILKEQRDGVIHEHRIKIDPGSKTTGIAILQEGTNRVVWAAELSHRGQRIKDALLSRRQLRSSRRSRKTRYRKARFLNRTKPKGWLAPSLMSRVSNITTWVNRCLRLCHMTAISMELVKFDTQKMENPEISGVEYQQGALAGYEVREYLLEKWGRHCAYCGAKNVALEIEHIIPRSRGGSDRVSNLALACHDCNQEKNNLTAAEYGTLKRKDFSNIANQAKTPMKGAGAVNNTRWRLLVELKKTSLPVETGSGGRTKWNRTRLGLPKAHWADAACVGASTPDIISAGDVNPILIKATGHGRRQMCCTDKYGFPISHRQRRKSFMGFSTGDMVKAAIPHGKNAGRHTGRVTIRFKPDFQLKHFSVHPKYLEVFHKTDGYDYKLKTP